MSVHINSTDCVVTMSDITNDILCRDPGEECDCLMQKLDPSYADYRQHRATRAALCEASVTLNGNPAKVTGYRNQFATVTDLTTRLSAEWSWEAVALVVNNGGRFTS